MEALKPGPARQLTPGRDRDLGTPSWPSHRRAEEAWIPFPTPDPSLSTTPLPFLGGPALPPGTPQWARDTEGSGRGVPRPVSAATA